jgi:hypothetical protein
MWKVENNVIKESLSASCPEQLLPKRFRGIDRVQDEGAICREVA